MGAIQAAALIVVRVVPIVVMIEVMVGVKSLVGVVGVSDPAWDTDRRNVHAGSGLVGVPLREVVVEQRLRSLADVLAVGLRAEAFAALRCTSSEEAAADVVVAWYVGGGVGATGRTLGMPLA